MVESESAWLLARITSEQKRRLQILQTIRKKRDLAKNVGGDCYDRRECVIMELTPEKRWKMMIAGLIDSQDERRQKSRDSLGWSAAGVKRGSAFWAFRVFTCMYQRVTPKLGTLKTMVVDLGVAAMLGQAFTLYIMILTYRKGKSPGRFCPLTLAPASSYRPIFAENSQVYDSYRQPPGTSVARELPSSSTRLYTYLLNYLYGVTPIHFT